MVFLYETKAIKIKMKPIIPIHEVSRTKPIIIPQQYQDKLNIHQNCPQTKKFTTKVTKQSLEYCEQNPSISNSMRINGNSDLEEYNAAR